MVFYSMRSLLPDGHAAVNVQNRTSGFHRKARAFFGPAFLSGFQTLTELLKKSNLLIFNSFFFLKSLRTRFLVLVA